VGRPKLQIDDNTVLEMRSQGKHIKEISQEFGVSTATLSRRIAELKYMKHLWTKFRELQGLQLTELQYRVLEAITPEKIDKASLLDLVKCLYILHKAQMLTTGKDSKIHGLLDYLLEIEREENRHRNV
jgi:DNA-binding MarR family transcriptional regulator